MILLAVIALHWMRITYRRLHRAIFHPRKRKKTWVQELHEDLGALTETFTDPGPRRLTVKGLPARLRLVVMAASGKDFGDLEPEMLDNVLDWIKPGLANATSTDH